MFMKYILLLLFLSPSLFAAPGCEKRVNLLMHKWIKHRQMPQFGQGHAGICYAYGAMQMAGNWREVNGLRITQNIALPNGIYAGLLERAYKQESTNKYDKSTLDQGSISSTISGIRKYGMCKTDVIQRSIKKFAKKKDINLNAFYEFTKSYILPYNERLPKEKFWWKLTFWKSKETRMTEGRAKAKKKATEKAAKKMSSYRDRFGMVDQMDIEKIRDVMEPYIDNHDYVGFFKDVFSDCFKKENIYLKSQKLPPLFMIKNKNHKKTTQRIVELLDRKKPTWLGMSYDHHILRNQYHKFNESTHVSLIVGKRVRNNRCQFLVRNSWGNFCKYDSAWECKKDPGGREVGLWMDAEKLVSNIRSVYYWK